MSKPILNENGESVDDLAIYCPKCGGTDIERGQMSGQNFDENGWYQAIPFKCRGKKCQHTWHNRVILASGGMRFSNW